VSEVSHMGLIGRWTM